METLKRWFTAIDVRITNWMSKYGLMLLRVSLGIVFVWFGVIKFVPLASYNRIFRVRCWRCGKR
jgi:uncharacterized membrane protein YkgB